MNVALPSSTMLDVMNSVNNHFIETLEVLELDFLGASAPPGEGEIRGYLKNDYLVNQYVLIRGTVLNDGVYKIKQIVTAPDNLVSFKVYGDLYEEFEVMTYVYGLAIPRSFLELVQKISDYSNDDQTLDNVGVATEKIDDYSIGYQDPNTTNWKMKFSSELNNYRRMYTDISDCTSYAKTRYFKH